VVSALALLLALTASRHNFPLRPPPPRPLSPTALRIVPASTPSKKYEGVVPSRRHVESRRADWVKSLALTADLHPVLRCALESRDEGFAPIVNPRDGSRDRRDDQTAPGYLLAYLPSHPSRSLPPPA